MQARDALVGAAVVVLVAIAGWFWLSPDDNDVAPDIQLLTITGAKLRLSGLRERPVLVTFWATTCPTCIKELPALKALYRSLGPYGLEVIGIAVYYDRPDQVMALAKQRDIPYPIALDLDRSAMRAFGMKRAITPTTILIAPDGRVVMRKTGAVDMDQLGRTIRAMLPAA